MLRLVVFARSCNGPRYLLVRTALAVGQRTYLDLVYSLETMRADWASPTPPATPSCLYCIDGHFLTNGVDESFRTHWPLCFSELLHSMQWYTTPRALNT